MYVPVLGVVNTDIDEITQQMKVSWVPNRSVVARYHSTVWHFVMTSMLIYSHSHDMMPVKTHVYRPHFPGTPASYA
jgi:hypothetical protein